MNKENVVKVLNLSKKFHSNEVLKDVSFEVNQGSFLALLGKNGSGKSTLLNILMGIELLDSGDCFLFDQDIKKDPYFLKNDIGHVSEKIQFDYPIKVSEFLESYRKFYQNFDMKFVIESAKNLGISLDKQFAGYSRGQKMQIVLLAAMAHNPKLLLIDEVTSVLDASARKFFMSQLKDFTTKGGTVILTTNIVNEVQYYCDEVIFIDNKNIKFQTRISEIPISFNKVRTNNPNHPIINRDGVAWVGINSDGTQSYIIPKAILSEFDDLLDDKRAVTLEDLYIYHSQGGSL